ncbi:MAG: hypothetical protein COZ69_11390 [Deltaproteobacteria bacterium CG_4_8_14_3_um_filter_45_9]|nr:MAG: hypothetical protein COS40_15305 [Deltaproteobacteria bacterium CG03_land_8_20_14_0_80_45_14]PIX22320.1 MAG: hypothetical protein COZ69_11390 [Deltaproteobacteria bacterium CG_4_8_14_3_um_filter_45_9]
MGITQLITQFYRKLPRETFRKEPTIGQLFWMPSLHINKIPMIMEVERADPKEVYATKFHVRNLRENDFKAREKLPIKSLSLRITEELIVSKAKKRPAVVAWGSPMIFEDMEKLLTSIGRPHLREYCIAVIPIYNIETVDHAGGFPPVMVSIIKALMYNQFFYCPTVTDIGVTGGVARLDRIQIILPTDRAVYDPLPIALSEDALAVLLSMFRSWFGSVEEDLNAYKELLTGTLPPEALPRTTA